MAPIKSQNSNMLLAFLTLLGVIAIVAVVGFLMLRKGPEIIQGQAEVTEYRVSSKVPGRILEFRVKEGQSVNAGDTLAILEAPDVVAKWNRHGLLKLPHRHKTQKQSKARVRNKSRRLMKCGKSPGRRYHCREIISTHQESLRTGSDACTEAG